uniref:Uncharacterized protein n=1 Tax=Tanacetum cinerariifolium TaxID=118510 RepID=A0A6L2MNT3_TANCI|nr:hypothetical protein [Tanacetum cinerariifolium]
MDPNSSLGKNFLGDDVVVISSDKVEGSGDWNSLKYQETVVSKGKKVINTLSLYKMETNKISERYTAPCFVNGLEAYDEVNLELNENLISNEFAVKLCLDYEVNKGKKLVKKELIVALKGEIYFVKFIINPEEDDSEPGVILGRSFLRLAHRVIDFGYEVITIYPEPDPFEDNSKKTRKRSDELDQLLNFNFDDVPKFAGSHLTQDEAKKEALAILDETWRDKMELDGKTVKEEDDVVKRIKGEALKEKDDPGAFIFPIRLEGKVNENALADTGSNINTMPYQIYETLGREEMKKIDRGITMINHTQAEAMRKLSNVLCQVGVTTIIAKFLMLDIQIDCDSPIVTLGTHEGEAESSRSKCPRQHETVEEVLLLQFCHKFLLWEGCSRDAKSRVREAGSDEEIFTSSKKIIRFRLGGRAHNLTLLEFARILGLYQGTELEEEGFNVYFERGLRSDEHFNAQAYWLSIIREEHLSLSRSHTSTIINLILRVIHKMITYGLCRRTTEYDKIQKNDLWLLTMFDARHQNGYANVAWLARKCWVLTEDVVRSLSALIYYRDLDTTTLRDLIDSNGKLILEDPYPGVPRVGSHTTGKMYHGVFEHMAGVYSVLLKGAYNPPGYAQPQYDQYYQQYQPPTIISAATAG